MRQAFAHEAVLVIEADEALSSAGLNGPDGVITRWQFRSARPSPVRKDEAEHAERLART